jgi:hypothetical protein
MLSQTTLESPMQGSHIPVLVLLTHGNGTRLHSEKVNKFREIFVESTLTAGKVVRGSTGIVRLMTSTNPYQAEYCLLNALSTQPTSLNGMPLPTPSSSRAKPRGKAD